jgi:hypothetical protein
MQIFKRVLLHTAALNLGLLMRTLFGVDTPRSLQGRVAALFAVVWSLVRLSETLWARLESWYRSTTPKYCFRHASQIRANQIPAHELFCHGLLG